MKNTFYILIFCFLLIFSVSCEEKLPLRVEPENVAEVFLEMTKDKLVIFKPGIRNIFDDAFDANPYIDGSIYMAGVR